MTSRLFLWILGLTAIFAVAVLSYSIARELPTYGLGRDASRWER